MASGRTGRNSPCPCGSGQKFKKCCGQPGSAVDDEAWRRGIAEASAEFQRKIKANEDRYGKTREIVSAEFQGDRMVAVGDQLFSWNKWKTFTDFLFDYPRLRFGPEWGSEELAKPENKRHEIVRWYAHVCEYQKQQTPGSDGIYEMVADGITFSYFAFAYDLYVLQHHQKLQDRVIARLKHADQFQGARYELTVTATLIRAGFDMEFEDESDGETKHPELVATHRATGEIFDVEAKSRHRAGVMGCSGAQEEMNELRLGIRRILNKAGKKFRDRTFVAFVDANVPPERFAPEETPWQCEIVEEVKGSVSDAGGVSPFALVVITNFADHYRKPGETEPGRLSYTLTPSGGVKCPIQNASLIEDIGKALTQYGNIPNDFPCANTPAS